MKVIFLTAALMVLASAHPDEEWFKYKQTYKKRYDLLEDIRRHIQYLNSKLAVEEQNIKFRKGESTFSMGINHFSDWYEDELRSLFISPNGVVFKGKQAKLSEKGPPADSINWVKLGAVTEVKDQKQCNCSYAFTVAGALEGQMAILYKNMTNLSAQQLVDCTPNNNTGCKGGHPTLSFQYVLNNGGIDTEESYPYQGVQQECKSKNAKIGVTFTDLIEIKDEQKLKRIVNYHGPATVLLQVDITSFAHYSGGVYDGKCNQSQSLALLAVGYDHDEQNGKDYWLFKNSWSTKWGEKGYARVLRNVNKCQLASNASFPLYI